MIDLKNYERLSDKEFVKKLQEHYYGDHDKRDITYLRLAELEDMIEQGKLVEKIEPKTAKERVSLELKQLEERQQKLYDFIQTSKFQELSSIQKDLLVQQNNIMVDYIGTLENRLGNWEE